MFPRYKIQIKKIIKRSSIPTRVIIIESLKYNSTIILITILPECSFALRVVFMVDFSFDYPVTI